MNAPITNPRDVQSRDVLALLTPKERECLQRWMHHATAKEIALELGISHHAVEKRLKSARQKLGVGTSLQAARLLAEAEGYGQTVSGGAEVAAAGTDRQEEAVGEAASQSPRPRRRPLIIGAVFMIISFLGVLALSSALTQAEPQQSTQVEVVNRDAITMDEFNSIVDRTFNHVDKDKSGFLEEAEFRNATMKAIRIDRTTGASPSQSVVTLAEVDENRDGRVSRDEYRGWLGKPTVRKQG